ncbi:MAG: DNA primase [Candidatus Gracilibacteria bacterium]|nr:DNA primase [Candidatus Gracilibacteria bacterium]MDD2908542.1 DNA primase [Candidatus Gracilibacteria bacterium]
MSISQEIDNKISIVDLAGRYLTLKKAGVNYKALCPFHNEKTASFVVSPAKNIAYCFSCHTGGGPVKFLSEIEKIPYGEAVQKLAGEAGIELKTDFYKENKENRGDLYEMHKTVAESYHSELFKEENSIKLKYLLDRGLSIETIKNFKLGYSGDPRSLFYKLTEKGFSEKDIIESGIFVSAFKDKFYSRIVFPISNFTGNVVGFTGRVLDSSLPKYLNSPTTKIFDKSSILYGLNLAKSEISKKGFVIIVEGQMDTISLHQYGFTNTIAISGTALTEEQIKLLKRLTKKIYLSLDNDNAGINATFASLDATINEDIDVKIINFGEAKDPDEYLKSGKDFGEIIKNAMSPISFYLREGIKKYDIASIQGKKSLIKDVFQFLKRINSRIEIDIHIKEISNLLGVSVNVLYEEFKNTKLKTSEKQDTIPFENKAQFDIYEEITAYLGLYNFFDLFLEKFEYNLDNIKAGESLLILKNAILHKEGLFEDGMVDVDRLKTIELFIEESNINLNKETITKKFLDLILKLNKRLFEEEKAKLDEQMKNDPKNSNILKEYMDLIQKGKKMGIGK